MLTHNKTHYIPINTNICNFINEWFHPHNYQIYCV